MSLLTASLVALTLFAVLAAAAFKILSRLRNRPAYVATVTTFVIFVATAACLWSFEESTPLLFLLLLLITPIIFGSALSITVSANRRHPSSRTRWAVRIAGMMVFLTPILTFVSISSGPSWSDALTTAVDPEERVRNWIASGAAAFNPKPQMIQGNAEIVTLRVVENPDDAILRMPMTGGPVTLSWRQDVSLVMRAELKGSGFDIEALSPTDQFLRNGRYEWAWKIVPKKWGKRQLHLTTIVLAPIPGLGEKASVANVTTRSVDVLVNPNAVVSGFLSTYWQWLATTVFIPIAIWLWKRRTKQIRQRQIGFRNAG